MGQLSLAEQCASGCVSICICAEIACHHCATAPPPTPPADNGSAWIPAGCRGWRPASSTDFVHCRRPWMTSLATGANSLHGPHAQPQLAILIICHFLAILYSALSNLSLGSFDFSPSHYSPASSAAHALLAFSNPRCGLRSPSAYSRTQDLSLALPALRVSTPISPPSTVVCLVCSGWRLPVEGVPCS
jgi:hypothetical protein